MHVGNRPIKVPRDKRSIRRLLLELGRAMIFYADPVLMIVLRSESFASVREERYDNIVVLVETHNEHGAKFGEDFAEVGVCDVALRGGSGLAGHRAVLLVEGPQD